MQFLVWYDEDPKKTSPEKIGAAVAAYRARFATAPGLVLVNTLDYADVAGVLVRSERTVQPNNFWVGAEDSTDGSAADAPLS